MMIKFIEKVLIWLKKVSSIKKPPISKVKSFLKSNFDLNQIRKIVLTQSHEIWTFNAPDLRYIFIKDGKNVSKL